MNSLQKQVTLSLVVKVVATGTAAMVATTWLVLTYARDYIGIIGNIFIAVGVLGGVLYFTRHMFPRKTRRTTFTALANPPALHLQRMVRFLTTQKGFREVFEPTFADMAAEYFEALSRKEHFEARKIVIACYFNVGMLLIARPVVRAITTVMGWMKAS